MSMPTPNESNNQPRPVRAPLTFGSDSVDSTATGVDSHNSEQSAGATRYRVCVIEDSFKHLTTVFAALNQHGYDAEHFPNPAEGRIALERGIFHLVIVGDAIAGGPEACDAFIGQIRESAFPRVKALPVLVLTSTGDRNRLRRLAALGASPVAPTLSPKELHTTIYNAVNKNERPSPSINRILLLEDSYALTWSLWNTLTAAGREVDHVLSAQDALESARNARHDLIIVGHHDAGKMPTEQLFGRLRFAKRKTDANIPIVALTDDHSDENRAALRRAGILATLPRNPAQAKGTILTWLENGVPANQPAEIDSGRRAGVTSLKVPKQELPRVENIGTEPPLNFNFSNNRTEDAPLPELPRIDISMPAGISYPQPQVPEVAAPRGTSLARKVGRLFIGAGIVLALIATIAWWMRSKGGSDFPLATVTASTSTLTRTVPVSGHVISTHQVDLPAARTGQLYRVFLEDGQLVRKGETLAILDNREALINVRRAEAQVFRLRTELELAEDAIRLYRKMGIPEDDRAVMVETQTAKNLAQSKLRAAETELQAVQIELDRYTINSPFAGVVIHSEAVEGKWVEAGEPLYALADLNTLEVALQPDDPEDIAALALEQTVNLRVEGTQRAEWVQKISRVINVPPDSAMSRGKPAAYSAIDEEAPNLTLGQRVRGEILTEVTSASVTVPVETIFLHRGAEHVAVVRRNRAEFVPVEIGIRSYPNVEILKGVKQGDQIAFPRQNLRNGQAVTPKPVAVPQTEPEASFPLRAQFDTVPRYSANDLEKTYRHAMVVDVRSKAEYDTLRLTSATHVPLDSEDFMARILALRAKDPTAPLVFYCANAWCPDSYLAVLKAQNGGVKNVFAYDGGVLEWIREHRQLASLLGIAPAPLDRLISRAYYYSRQLDEPSFARERQKPNTVIVDFDPKDGNTASASPSVEHLSPNEFAKRLDDSIWRSKTLILVDRRGDRAPLLHYLLEYKGYSHYFFHRPRVNEQSDAHLTKK